MKLEQGTPNFNLEAALAIFLLLSGFWQEEGKQETQEAPSAKKDNGTKIEVAAEVPDVSMDDGSVSELKVEEPEKKEDKVVGKAERTDADLDPRRAESIQRLAEALRKMAEAKRQSRTG